MKLVEGVGIADIRRKDNLEVYEIWKGMLRRCYSYKFQEKYPTYKGCSVAEEWHRLSAFKSWWMQSNWKPGLQLDKDIINRSNKVYGPDNCSFVSQRANLLITDRANDRGAWPVGVYFDNSARKFVSKLAIDGDQKYLGLFSTPDSAFAAYKLAKEAEIKRVAAEELAAGNITTAVYDALMLWEIV